jgi:hypothetical protein
VHVESQLLLVSPSGPGTATKLMLWEETRYQHGSDVYARFADALRQEAFTDLHRLPLLSDEGKALATIKTNVHRLPIISAIGISLNRLVLAPSSHVSHVSHVIFCSQR